MKSILKIIGVFLVINLLLFAGQKIFHSKDAKRAKEIEATLTTMTQDMENEENELTVLSAELDTLEIDLENYEKSLDDLLNKYPNGAPPGVVADFNSTRDKYDQLIDNYNVKVGDYNLKFQSYDNHINSYNILVTELQALDSKISSYFYVIPIPIPRLSK